MGYGGRLDVHLMGIVYSGVLQCGMVSCLSYRRLGFGNRYTRGLVRIVLLMALQSESDMRIIHLIYNNKKEDLSGDKPTRISINGISSP